MGTELGPVLRRAWHSVSNLLDKVPVGRQGRGAKDINQAEEERTPDVHKPPGCCGTAAGAHCNPVEDHIQR